METDVGEQDDDGDQGRTMSAAEKSEISSTISDEKPTLTTVRKPPSTSVPVSVMSHPIIASGADLERGPTGPRNASVDDEGRIVVNWTSNHDEENPKHWPRSKKLFNVIVISLMTFLCPLCSAMFVYAISPAS
jgi:hypothetical protein